MTAPRCVRQVCESCGLPLPARHDNPVDPAICWAEYDLRAKIACRDRVIARLKSELEGMHPVLLGPDACWDEKRDARLYAGPNPVVAHPPCQLWGPFAPINFKRWGGAHNIPANDGGKFAHALACVRAFGGVLEHPAFSRAWGAFGLNPPCGVGWRLCGPSEWVCEVWQSAYGHRARKRTWLLYRGAGEPIAPNSERLPGSHQCGFHDQRGKEKNKPTLSKREASETPLEFARYLITLAKTSRSWELTG